MNSKNPSFQNMVRDILAKFCDECGSAYNESDLKILQNNNKAILVHLSCSSCGKTHVATIMKQLGITNRTAFNSDLKPEELTKFAGKDAITLNDILDIYEWGKHSEKKTAQTSLKELE